LIPVTALPFAATAGGFLLVLAIVFPVAGVLLSLVLGGRHAERIALGLMPAGIGVAIAIAVLLWRSGKPLVYILGGFAPPLGIALRADGFSAVMPIVISAAGFFARANFGTPQGMTEARAPLAFWILLQALWAALNIVFLGGRF
jgi:multicomponent Na+:H+ antiporter subunit D